MNILKNFYPTPFDKISKDGKIWYIVLKVEANSHTQSINNESRHGWNVQSFNGKKALYKITYWDGYKFTGTMGIYENETFYLQKANVKYDEPLFIDLLELKE